MRSLSSLAVQSQNTEATDEVWLILLRIRHASITPGGVLRCVNNIENITGGSDNEEYVAYPFQLDLPGEEEDQPSVAKLRIDNVDLQLVEAVRGLPSPATVDFEVIIASQPTVVEIGLNGLTLRVVDYDKFELVGTITLEEIFTEPVSLDITPSRLPGCF